MDVEMLRKVAVVVGLTQQLHQPMALAVTDADVVASVAKTITAAQQWDDTVICAKLRILGAEKVEAVRPDQSTAVHRRLDLDAMAAHVKDVSAVKTVIAVRLHGTMSVLMCTNSCGGCGGNVGGGNAVVLVV